MLPLRVTLAPEAAAVRTARSFTAEACRAAGTGEDVRDTVVLLTSEVVTNAFMHGRSEARLAVYARPGEVRVEVGDDNSRHPKAVEQDVHALDGRGLSLVEMLAASWGVDDDAYGKTVWFCVTGGS